MSSCIYKESEQIKQDAQFLTLQNMLVRCASSIILPDYITKFAPKVFANIKTPIEITSPLSLIWRIEMPLPLDPNVKYIFSDETITPQNLEKLLRSAYSRQILQDMLNNPCRYSCQALEVNGNAIFTKDGKHLIYYSREAQAHTYEVPEGTESIEYQAFMGVQHLAEIKLPPSLQTIKEKAFSLCRDLQAIELPDYLTDIPDYAFSDCPALQINALPSSLKRIGIRAFYQTKLKAITLPQNVEIIEEEAFAKSRLSQLIIQEPDSCSLKHIGIRAFSETGLRSILIPSSVEVIDAFAFFKTRQLQTLTIPKTVKCVGHKAFAESGIRSVILETTLCAGRIFDNCTNLNHVQLPQNMETIPEGMFACCYALNSIELPSTLKIIQKNAFYFCRLQQIAIPANVTSIESHAFVRNPCPQIELPTGITHVGADAFSTREMIVPVNNSLHIFSSVYHRRTRYPRRVPLKLSVVFPDAHTLEIELPKDLRELKPKALQRFEQMWQNQELDHFDEVLFDMMQDKSKEKVKFACEHLAAEDASIYFKFLKKVESKLWANLIDEPLETYLIKIIKLNVFSVQSLREMLPLAQNKQMTTAVAYILEKLNEIHSHQDSLDL